jgi:hypothetical protein
MLTVGGLMGIVLACIALVLLVLPKPPDCGDMGSCGVDILRPAAWYALGSFTLMLLASVVFSRTGRWKEFLARAATSALCIVVVLLVVSFAYAAVGSPPRFLALSSETGLW